MEAKDLKKLSISNLNLIILNNKNNDNIRKYAELELKKRIRNVGWDYQDILHIDDKVIASRGLDVNDYLLSPYVNMQKLMETYFAYDYDTTYDTNGLLFSEKHLCNSLDFGEPFFRNICDTELFNLEIRIENFSREHDIDKLTQIKELLEKRQADAKEAIKETIKENIFELPGTNEAMYRLDEDVLLSFLYNISDEERYDLMRTPLGRIKLKLAETINDSPIIYSDLVQSLYGLKVVKKDSSKLNEQKRKLYNQVREGYVVNYDSEVIQKALKRNKTL